jgi:hypothetical protein
LTRSSAAWAHPDRSGAGFTPPPPMQPAELRCGRAQTATFCATSVRCAQSWGSADQLRVRLSGVPVSDNLSWARLVACAGELHGVSAAAIPTCVLGATDWLSLALLRLTFVSRFTGGVYGIERLVRPVHVSVLSPSAPPRGRTGGLNDQTCRYDGDYEKAMGLQA